MKKLIKTLICSIIILSFCGCNNSEEISRLAFVVSVGYDVDSYSFHIVNPAAFSKNGGDATPLITKTVSAPDIYTAMDKLNSSISEKCDFSHIKMVIFSYDKLKTGATSEVEAMLNSNTFHPNVRIAVCAGKASEYMKNFKIPLDANPAEYYENIFDKSSNPYAPDTSLKDMHKKYKNQVVCNIFPILDNSTKAVITKNAELSGIADSDETSLFNLLTKKNFSFNYAIDKGTVLKLKNKDFKAAVSLKDKTPVIYVNARFDGDIIWSAKNTDTEKLIEKACLLLKKDIASLMNNCSTKYKADIFEFYKLAKPCYLTVESWEKENWQKLFEQAKYSVNIGINRIN